MSLMAAKGLRQRFSRPNLQSYRLLRGLSGLLLVAISNVRVMYSMC